MKRCARCGRRVPDDFRKCPHCGSYSRIEASFFMSILRDFWYFFLLVVIFAIIAWLVS